MARIIRGFKARRRRNRVLNQTEGYFGGRKNRFRQAGVNAPLHTYPKFGADAPANPHFTYLHSDAPIQPFDTEPLAALES